MIARSGGGRLAEGAVMTVGGVLESCSSTLWWLFASRRATAVLWMLWRHILQGESSCFILYTSILSQWLTAWCVFLDILDYPEGKNMCVHACLCARMFVCTWPQCSSHCFSIFYSTSPSPQTSVFLLQKSTRNSSGALRLNFCVSQVIFYPLNTLGKWGET